MSALNNRSNFHGRSRMHTLSELDELLSWSCLSTLAEASDPRDAILVVTEEAYQDWESYDKQKNKQDNKLGKF